MRYGDDYGHDDIICKTRPCSLCKAIAREASNPHLRPPPSARRRMQSSIHGRPWSEKPERDRVPRRSKSVPERNVEIVNYVVDAKDRPGKPSTEMQESSSAARS